MYWMLCFAISLIILLIAVCGSLMLKRSKIKKRSVSSVFYVFFVGVFLSIIVCMLPLCRMNDDGEQNSIFEQILMAVHHALQAFTVDADFQSILSSIDCNGDVLDLLYSSYTASLLVVAPFLTFGLVLSFFKDFVSHIRLILGIFRPTYVFTELNEKSLVLANDIRQNHKHAMLIFGDADNDNENSHEALLAEALGLGSLCFKSDITRINFSICRSKILFFAISNDEELNLKHTLNLVEKYKNKDDTDIYTFSTSIESELVLSNLDTHKVRVKRINEVRSFVYNQLYTDGYVLFRNARADENGRKWISAVIIGMGLHGTEMLKALTWYCQMDGYSLEINAYDVDPSAKEHFEVIAPDLLSEKYNGVSTPGDAEYLITIHSGVDVSTRSFFESIEKIRRPSYVLVSLGSSDKNIQTSVELRRRFEKLNCSSNIQLQTIVYHTNSVHLLNSISDTKNVPYNIGCSGYLDSYREDVILNSKLENSALQSRKRRGKSCDDFWKYESNYKSSLASAIHLKARRECNIPGANKPSSQLTPEEKRTISVIEHRRWNAYMRSEGYTYGEVRNDMGKVHPCIVPFSSLPKEEQEKDVRTEVDDI